jgi:hypothetical protein
VALNCLKDTTTPEVQLSRPGNRRAQMRRMEPEEFQRTRGIAFDRGRSGPAGLNAAQVDALNDPAVRKQLENLGSQMLPKDKLMPEALDAWQKAEIANQRQGGLAADQP